MKSRQNDSPKQGDFDCPKAVVYRLQQESSHVCDHVFHKEFRSAQTCSLHPDIFIFNLNTHFSKYLEKLCLKLQIIISCNKSINGILKMCLSIILKLYIVTIKYNISISVSCQVLVFSSVIRQIYCL